MTWCPREGHWVGADGTQVEEPQGGKWVMEVLGKHVLPSHSRVLWGVRD